MGYEDILFFGEGAWVPAMQNEMRLEDGTVVHAYRNTEGRSRKPEAVQTAGCDRAVFSREDAKIHDGFVDDLVMAQNLR